MGAVPRLLEILSQILSQNVGAVSKLTTVLPHSIADMFNLIYLKHIKNRHIRVTDTESKKHPCHNDFFNKTNRTLKS